MASKFAVEALPTLFSATPSTMTPFLYQTRTLSTLQWTRSGQILQSHLTEIKRQFSSSPRRLQANPDETTTTVSDPQGDRSAPTIRRTIWKRILGPDLSDGSYGKNASSGTVAWEPQVPEEEVSVVRRVFRTGTPKPLGDMWWANTEKPKAIKNGLHDVRSSDLFDAEDAFWDEENETEAWARRSVSRQDRQTTITPSERAAFKTIFENIRNKAKDTQRYGELDGYGKFDEDGGFYEKGMTSSPAARQTAQTKLDSILGSAISGLGWTREEKEEVVNRYPPSLRALAAKAIGLDFDEEHFEETPNQEEETMNNDLLEELRKPVREAVEAKMNAAETDVELWAVMEEEVFPLIEKLGLESAGKKEDVPLQKHGKKEDSPEELVLATEEEQTSRFEPIVHDGQVVSPLAFYGPLYPSYLLLGLRLLDRSFAKPSPLALSILPKIKSLGLISHVLGASTPLYNELLIMHWYRYDDFTGAIRLLYEMVQSGLRFNRETLEIVENIMRMQSRVAKGDRGMALQLLWSMPEFAPGRFRYWQHKITKMLSEGEESPGRFD